MSELLAVAGSDNVFRDLGFPEAEAQDLLLRTDLVIQKWFDESEQRDKWKLC